MRRTLGIWIIALTPALSEGAGAEVSGGCTPIRFETGRFSATIHGVAPPESVVCYSLATGRGQRAVLRVMSGRNTIFSIEGLVDAHDAYEFRTEQKAYRILVGQLMRSVTPESFAISVSVR